MKILSLRSRVPKHLRCSRDCVGPRGCRAAGQADRAHLRGPPERPREVVIQVQQVLRQFSSVEEGSMPFKEELLKSQPRYSA